MQRSHGEPLGNTRFGQLLAYNPRRSLEKGTIPSSGGDSAAMAELP